jgi:hypothetical protein
LPLPRDPRAATSIAHHLRVLDARAQLHRFRWIPRRILAAHFTRLGAQKIPDGMIAVRLPERDDYWEFRAYIAVEVELQWRGSEQRRRDIARMVAGLGHSYSSILLLTETDALATQWLKAISATAGEHVEISVGGKPETVLVPHWVLEFIDILPIDRAHDWTPTGEHFVVPGRTFEDWWTPVSHWGVLERQFKLDGRTP